MLLGVPSSIGIVSNVCVGSKNGLSEPLCRPASAWADHICRAVASVAKSSARNGAQLLDFLAKYFNTDSNFKGLATGQRPSVSVSVTFTLGILLLKWEAEAEAELTLAAREGEKFIVAVVALSSLIVRP